MENRKNMNNRMQKLFYPSIALKRHMIGGKVINGFWYVDLVIDFPLARQFMREAGISDKIGNKISDADLDAFINSAGNRGYSVETIGE